LGIDDVVDRELSRTAELGILGQPVGLAQSDGGQAVSVHAAAEVAVFLVLLANEEGEGLFDRLVEVVVFGGLVSEPSGEEGKQSKSGPGRVVRLSLIGEI